MFVHDRKSQCLFRFRLAENYLRCRYCVKNRLKMLIYLAQTALFRLFLPGIGCLENDFQRPVNHQDGSAVSHNRHPYKSDSVHAQPAYPRE